MKGTLALAIALAVSLTAPACAQQPDAASAAAALREGRYDDAIAAYTRLVDDGGGIAARRGLVRALMAVGRYDEAERAARAGTALAAKATPAGARDPAHTGPTGRARPDSAAADTARAAAAVGADGRTAAPPDGAAAPRSPAIELANTLGEVLYARGKVEEAEAAFRTAIDGGATDVADARVNLAILLERRGARAQAREIFDSFINFYNRGDARTAEALTAVGTAVRHLGNRDPALFHDAVRAYREAIAADSTDQEARLLLAELLLDKYNSTDAQTVLREVLRVNPRHPRALLALARAKRFDGSSEALELVQTSLEVAPDYVPALVFLAALRLELEDDAGALEHAEHALDVNPASLEALAILAATHFLRGDTAAYEATRQRALALDPGFAELYNTLAELAARQRRYAEAVTLAQRAVALDSTSWRGYGLLGLNQLRTGRLDSARTNLETAFAGDPYNVWIKNTLDLLDTFGEYESRETPRFELFLHGREADLLFPYMAEIAEQAYDTLSARYGYRPDPPVRVEVYPRHADFSVRTVGLAGLGALGVSFGNLLVLDSPAAREAGSFNWASTLWHEFAHAITLGMTDHLIPRWFSEGLSVLEERRARPSWGMGVTPDFLAAYAAGKLLPIERLNDGFVRPSYPQQVMHAYYQASLVAEMIERDHGFDAIRAMLDAYREGRSTEAVFRDVLGTSLEDFDDAFDAYLEERFGARLAALGSLLDAVAADGDAAGADGGIGVKAAGPTSPEEAVRRADAEPGDFLAQLTAGRALLDTDDPAAARPYLERARDLFPEYAGPDSPYRLLARLETELGRPRAAAAALEAQTARNEADYTANVELAGLLETLGDAAGAAAALERAATIYPYEIEMHARLAGLYERLGDAAGLVRERRAIVALEPVDRAGALYDLARAYLEAGDTAAARREVLRALEIAPGFAEAQDLLLRLHRESGGAAHLDRKDGR
ncbi:MAG TPA: tetratricopeptide repeat protein [Longimicrobiales bacterium]